MSTDKVEQLKIKFDHHWYYRQTDDNNIDIIKETSEEDDSNWISIQLPHIIDETGDEKKNWCYRKQFQWKRQRENSDQRVYLIFKSIKSNNVDENNNKHTTIDSLTIWLNKVQIYSDTFQSSKISIDLTEHLTYKDESDDNNGTNILWVYCKNASLSSHSYLLLPSDLNDAIDLEENGVVNTKTSNKLPLRKNRVLDYLISFREAEGQFDIGFNSNVKCPVISKLSNPPEINVSEDQAKQAEQTVHKKQNTKEYSVPRLAIVMLIVGTRGDVQPFIA